MTKRACRKLGLLLLVLAVCFVVYALGDIPQAIFRGATASLMAFIWCIFW